MSPHERDVEGTRTAVIEFDGVTKVYPGGTIAVDDLSLIAPTGRITVVVGPAGCGKTTVLRMVNRLVDPSAGRVLIDEAPNTTVRRSVLRRSIGYVLAGGGLFPHRTVVENIETVPVLLGAKRRESRELAHALLERVGLSETFADRYPGQLSTGQQLRVALARALAADPPILLLDEPFSTLDPVVRGDLQDDLLDLQQAAPKTVLFVTHDIDEAIKLGDQIAVMDTGGRLVQIATPETLLVHPGTDFVADFLGRDRGIRKLAFLPVGDLTLAQAATVQAGATAERARALADQHGTRWLLVLDPDRLPRGWVDTAALTPGQIVSGSVVFPLGGTFYPDESVLAALDAAILSPPGLAVCIDDDGMVLGVVSHADVAAYLAARGPSMLPHGGSDEPPAPRGRMDKTGPPTVERPAVEPPTVEEPRVEEPRVEQPKVVQSKVEEPTVERPAPPVRPARLDKPTPAPAPTAARVEPAPPAADPPTVEVPKAAPEAPVPPPVPAPAAAPVSAPVPVATVRQAEVAAPIVRSPAPPPPAVKDGAPAGAPYTETAPQTEPAPRTETAPAAPAVAPVSTPAAVDDDDEDLDSGRWEWDAETAEWVRVPAEGQQPPGPRP